MSLRTHEVFLASNFDEFADLRRLLVARVDGFRGIPLRAVSLDDDRPRTAPPARHSLQAAQRCDVMVLLVGRRYGGVPSGQKASYAHLEHRAAVAAEPAPVVLPWLLRLGGEAEASLDPEVAAWRDEVRELHTVGWLDDGVDPELVADEIFQEVLGALFESLSTEERRRLLDAEAEDDLGRWGDGEEDGEGVDPEELAFLESRPGAVRDGGGETDELPDEATLLRHPARAAALEQRREALKAMRLGERSAAVLHLRRALEQRPLDLESNYWLGHLLATTGRRDDCRQALDLALRAVKVARDQGRALFTAAAYGLAARAAARLGDHDLSLEHARRAAATAPWFAGAHQEVAAAHARRGELDAAFEAAGDACFRWPPSLRRLRRNPALQRHPRALRAFEERLGQRVREAVVAIFDAEAAALGDLEAARDDLRQRVDEATVALDRLRGEADPRRVLDLVRQGRASARRCVDWLALQGEWILGWASHHRMRLAAERREAEGLSLRNRAQLRREAGHRPNFVPAGVVLVPVAILVAAGLLDLGLGISSGLWLLAATAGAGLALDVGLFLRRRRRFRRQQDEVAAALRDQEAEAERRLRRAERDFERFRAQTGRHFQRRVHGFEEAALRWAILSPHDTLRGARPGDLLRFGDAPPEAVELDFHLLPPDLRDVLELDTAPPPRHRLYRVLGDGGGGGRDAPLRAVRWACWFEPPATGR